ncbi:mannose receptor, c type 1a [Plakobranchus ocellatus]|uniref:Mannose receptor, c type 1a n=1 Tax=Plakobranchus ocellatus TaxID=259542 RepID=A0AAV4AP17_9GAST|nr:mannose receptor, c type 1a [Plakobranchus ocellatus]
MNEKRSKRRNYCRMIQFLVISSNKCMPNNTTYGSYLNGFCFCCPAASCTPGWKDTPSGEVCVKIFNDPTKNWFNARRACQKAGGDLAIIRDDTMNNFIKEQVVSNDVCAWTGLHTKPGEGKWYWLDEHRTPTYTDWVPNSFLNSTFWKIFSRLEKCACVTQSDLVRSAWYNRPCPMSMSYICEKPTEMTCDPGWTKTPTINVCIKIKNEREGWFGARRACQRLGGDLVTIYDEIMSNFIIDLVVAKNIDFAWTGLRYKLDGGRWVWLDNDGTPNYTHWRINPDQSTYFQGGFNFKCAGVAQTKRTEEGYYSRTCFSRMRYICERPAALPCYQGWVKTPSGEACVKLIDEREPLLRSWHDARRMCQKHGGDLVKIRDTIKLNFITDVLIDSVPTWIGFHKLAGEDKWHWLDEDWVHTHRSCTTRGPEAAPNPPETSLYIGPMGRKDETCPLAMRALSLEIVARYGREYALAYSNGSSTGGAVNGGYGIYFLWPDGSTTRICGPIGESTCSYECELMAARECLRVVIEKQRERAALPGVVIFTDCRALVQALGGSRSEYVDGAVLLADYMQKTEGVQTVVQWLPSHLGVLGRWTSKRGKVTATETTNSVGAKRHRQALECGAVI